MASPTLSTAPTQLGTLAALRDHILRQRATLGAKRQMVAIVGAPGAGKSTVSDMLCNLINQAEPDSCAVVPMDGFHFDDAILEQRGDLLRKGAPHTFDVDGLTHLHTRLVAEPLQDIAVPVFDRAMELARAGARIVPATTQTLLIEGNYLLLQQAPWDRLHDFYDLTVYLDVPFDTLKARLEARWRQIGLEGDAFTAKMEGNDLPNVQLVINTSAQADIVFLNDVAT